ncbi:lipase family protein [Thalassoroseus pseudoceratinae]|uniref:alpha/beta hydrolase n=1 Tax=Thalassoroseus pseudoceratinae TaxID=2713176 RepID=UPI001421050C|nr:alpha/beta hydrolase [Thalassoroseus pseudoceratinae]
MRLANGHPFPLPAVILLILTIGKVACGQGPILLPPASPTPVAPALPEIEQSPNIEQPPGMDQAIEPVESYWVVSSRRCRQSGQPGCTAGEFGYVYSGPDGQKQVQDAAAFHASLQPDLPICVVVHGSFMEWAELYEIAPRIQRWIQSGQPLARAQFVFFTWPSEDRNLNLGPIDLAPRGVQASYNGIYLAHFLTQLPQQTPVSLVGHSHGTRVIGSALHMLGGGYVSRYRLAFPPQQRRIRTVFLAGAFDRHWLFPNGRFEAALPVMERMLNVVNRSDYSLQLYPLRRPFSDVAIGHVGLGTAGSAYLGPYRERYRDFDATRFLRATHGWDAYLREPEIAQVMANTVFFSEPVAIELQSKRPSYAPGVESLSDGSNDWCGCQPRR